MPSVSKKQHNLMAAVAKSPAVAKKTKIPQSVGQEFLEADKGKKFGTGGDVNYTYGGKGQINKQRTRGGSIYGVQKNVPNINLDKYEGKKEGGKVATKKLFGGKETRAEELKEAKALKSGKISKSQYVAGEKSEGHGKGAAKTATAIKSGKITPKQYAKAETMMCGGGKVKKMLGGGLAAGPIRRTEPAQAAGRAPAPTQSPAMQSALAAQARRSQPAPTQSPAMQSALAAQARSAGAFGGPNPLAGKKAPSLGRMAKGGLAAGHKSADGIATKGKTKARAVTMKKGGKC